MHRYIVATCTALTMILWAGAFVTDARAGGATSAPSKYHAQTDHSPAAHNAMERNYRITQFSSASGRRWKH